MSHSVAVLTGVESPNAPPAARGGGMKKMFPLPGLPSEGRATGHDPGFFLASESEKGSLARFEGPQPVRAQAIFAV